MRRRHGGQSQRAGRRGSAGLGANGEQQEAGRNLSRELLREWVRAGMAQAKRAGKELADLHCDTSALQNWIGCGRYCRKVRASENGRRHLAPASGWWRRSRHGLLRRLEVLVKSVQEPGGDSTMLQCWTALGHASRWRPAEGGLFSWHDHLSGASSYRHVRTRGL
jgi:hypothetical protein